MELTVQTSIEAPRERVWQIISDIDHSVDVIRGIEKIEVLERPENGLTGLKWRETRTMFGKEATEIMWVTEAEENRYYQTRAESHGSVYVSRMQIEGGSDRCVLSMSFEATPATIGGKIMWALTGFMFKGSTRKALEQDLADIKRAAEEQTE